MAEYLLGIDNGSTVTKAALFDLEGREVRVASRTLEMDSPHSGWAERDMGVLWQSTVEVIRELITASGVDPRTISGIGNSGHASGIYLLDRHGRPARPGILSLDTRAADLLAEWNAKGLHRQAFPRTIQSFWPSQVSALLAWIKRHEPDVYAQIGAILMCKDYIKYCLTGEITTDFTDMSGTSLMDVRNRSYSRELLELFDISEVFHALPTLAESFQIIGGITPEAARATGLAKGTPVVGGLYDVNASALGAGVHQPGQACIIAGSWSVNVIITAKPIVNPGLFSTLIYTTPGLWISIEASPTSTTNLEWFISRFCGEERVQAEARGISVHEACNELVASVPPGGTDVIFHPFLYGSNVQPTARAGFYGLSARHTKAHLLRALYEGVVYGHLSHMEKLQAAGARIDVSRLTGGGSRSTVWTQIFADALGLPMEVPEGIEIGARGAALSAGIGAGLYKDHADAVAKAVRIARRQEPNPAATLLYRARYAEYQRLVLAMQEPWDHLSRLSAPLSEN